MDEMDQCPMPDFEEPTEEEIDAVQLTSKQIDAAMRDPHWHNTSTLPETKIRWAKWDLLCRERRQAVQEQEASTRDELESRIDALERNTPRHRDITRIINAIGDAMHRLGDLREVRTCLSLTKRFDPDGYGDFEKEYGELSKQDEIPIDTMRGAYDRVVDAIKSYVDKQIEARPGLKFAGTYDVARGYPAGSLVSHAGAGWVAVAPIEAGEKPGRGAGWRLAIKSAQAKEPT